MTKIGIIGAMASEVASLKDLMEMNVIIKKAGMNFYDGILYGKSVVVVQCGYGKVNAGIHGSSCICSRGWPSWSSVGGEAL